MTTKLEEKEGSKEKNDPNTEKTINLETTLKRAISERLQLEKQISWLQVRSVVLTLSNYHVFYFQFICKKYILGRFF